MKQRTKQPYNLCPGMSSKDALFLAAIKRVGSLDLIRGRIAIYRAALPYDGHPSARNPISHMVDVSPLIRFKTNTIYGDYIMCAHALTERQTNRQTDRRAERKTGLMDRQNDIDRQAGIQADGHRQLILKTEYCFYICKSTCMYAGLRNF